MSASREPGPVTRLILEYDGSRFAGWARQPGVRTVQAEVEKALAVVIRRPSVELSVAGRTDAGVHARGQVASYVGQPARTGGVNALLPDDVAVLDCTAAAPGFDARLDATSRVYCYRVLVRRERSALEHGRALLWPHRVDRARLDECAAALVGRHDFTAFTPTETHHTRFFRHVFAACWRARDEGELLEFWIEADSFLRHMNRVLVGTMLQVADGRRAPADFVSLLSGRPRSCAGTTAAAHGLYLAGVGYDDERVLRPTN